VYEKPTEIQIPENSCKFLVHKQLADIENPDKHPLVRKPTQAELDRTVGATVSKFCDFNTLGRRCKVAGRKLSRIFPRALTAYA
jgi:hypothetical protein